MGRALRSCALAAMLGLGAAAPAEAAWQERSKGSGYSEARSLAGAAKPGATASNRTVSVSWPAVGGGVPVEGYRIRRYDAGGEAADARNGCSGVVASTSCQEADVAPGSWRYTVTPVRAGWRGGESPKSSAVVIGSARLSLIGSTTLDSLPATVRGTIDGYRPGQTLTFRLDDPGSGQLIGGTATPGTVPLTGSALVSIQVPAGVTNGEHTIYAIGSGGDVASARIIVRAGVSITTSAWGVGDSSSGDTQDRSHPLAFAGDDRVLETGKLDPGFGAAGRITVELNSPLAPGQAVSDGKLLLDLEADGGSDVCLFIETFRRSSGASLGSHGSAATPWRCLPDAGEQALEVPLPELTSSAIANDLGVRVNLSDAGGRTAEIDRATVVGATGSGTAFALYPAAIDGHEDLEPAGGPWSPTARDSVFFTSDKKWKTTARSDRWLEFGFPAYVPAGSAVTGATLTHAYRSDGGLGCYYLEVRSGDQVIGTHGSAVAPVSCASGLNDQVDRIELPEVNTAARANDLSVRLYVSDAARQGTLHDQVQIELSYVP